MFWSLLWTSAVDWEVFHVGGDTYLIVSNAQQDGASGSDNQDPLDAARSSSVIYRWQGVEKFVARHYLDIPPSADWETFTIGQQVFLVYANAKDNLSQVFRVKYSWQKK